MWTVTKLDWNDQVPDLDKDYAAYNYPLCNTIILTEANIISLHQIKIVSNAGKSAAIQLFTSLNCRTFHVKKEKQIKNLLRWFLFKPSYNLV